METNPIDVQIGKNVRKLRTKKGWSQEKLAREADMSLNFIGYVERGSTGMTSKSIVKIAKALGVAPGQLFQGL